MHVIHDGEFHVTVVDSDHPYGAAVSGGNTSALTEASPGGEARIHLV